MLLLIHPEYLRSSGKTDDNECANLFKDYQKCLTVSRWRRGWSLPVISNAHRQVALKDKGIDKLIDEAREDTKENDAVYMKRK